MLLKVVPAVIRSLPFRSRPQQNGHAPAYYYHLPEYEALLRELSSPCP